jgi:hypothetical protein
MDQFKDFEQVRRRQDHMDVADLALTGRSVS